MEPQVSDSDRAAKGIREELGQASVQTIERAKNIMLKPKQEWQVIEAELTSTQTLYKKYIAPLAAIGPICAFIGFSLIGISMPFVGAYRTPIGAGIAQAIVSFILALVGVFLVSLIVNALAPSFGAQKNQQQALKVAAYSYTPSWLAGLLLLIPALGILSLLLSLYGLYLLYHGLLIVMKSPREKTLSYTAVVVIAVIVLGIVLGLLTAALVGVGRPGLTAPTAVGGPAAPGLPGSPQSSADPALNKLEAMTKKMEAATARMEKGGEESAKGAGDVMSALNEMLGGAAQGKPVDFQQLKTLLPAALPDMKRTSASAENSEVMGIAASTAEAVYDSDNGQRVTLKIADMGNISGLAAFASGIAGSGEKETDTGYEKTTTSGNRKIHEKFDHQSKRGSIELLLDKRFLIEADGQGVDVATLQAALDKIDFGKLESMKTQSAQK